MKEKMNTIRKNVPLKVFGKVITYIFLVFVLIICIYPLVWTLLASLNANANSGVGLIPFPEVWHFDGYVTIFTKLKIHIYFFNSTVITTISTLASVIIVSMAAYVVARFKFRGKALVSIMFTATLFIPAVSISYPLYRMMRDIGLFDSYAAIIFVYSGLGIAVTYFIIRNFFLSIPREMDEAAAIDGASKLRTFLQIIMPLARPGIATAAILVFLSNWNEFYYATLLLESASSMTLPALVGQFRNAYSSDLNGILSALVVIVAPTIVLFCCMSDVFVKSLSGGAVKG